MSSDEDRRIESVQRVVLLMPEDAVAEFASFMPDKAPPPRLIHVDDIDGLRAAVHSGERTLLLSFGTSVTVPGDVIRALNGNAVNFHAASPEFPGRDPHHFAIYRGARRYGATAHRMTERVDSGPILAVTEFDVPDDMTPDLLLVRANECALALARDLVPALVRGESVEALDRSWGPVKTSRRDFRKLCRIPITVSDEELQRRLPALRASGFSNAFVDIHGQRFRHEGPVPDAEKLEDAAAWSGFTEAAYDRLLEVAKARFRFVPFSETPPEEPHVLWRHDIDFSVHRALRLAEIENRKGLRSTYFFMLNSAFYSLEDPVVLERARTLLSLGHHAGLHYDPPAGESGTLTDSSLSAAVSRARDRLESILGHQVSAVSFHNPDVNGLITVDQPLIAGLANAYGRQLRKDYTYCSDSNGYWRYTPLPDVLADPRVEQLHVLTHPGWWTPEAMPPRARVERCVMGRARSVMMNYDAGLRSNGRLNIE